MTKQGLRKLYLEKRKALSEGEYAHLNLSLYHQFFIAVDLSFIKVIHIFLPITSKREVDTWPIIERIRREYPHVRFSIPRVNTQTEELENFFFEGLHQLSTNAWGIQEPRQGVPTEPSKIDMVMVPLLAFDLQGNRLGYGKGYYDKFLQQCRSDVKKIGLSLFQPEELIPSETYDVKLDAALTPAGYINF